MRLDFFRRVVELQKQSLTDLPIEYNGDPYRCDRFVYAGFKLGNIGEVHDGELAFSARQKKFSCAKREALPRY